MLAAVVVLVIQLWALEELAVVVMVLDVLQAVFLPHLELPILVVAAAVLMERKWLLLAQAALVS
jgi:hypothetical protein